MRRGGFVSRGLKYCLRVPPSARDYAATKLCLLSSSSSTFSSSSSAVASLLKLSWSRREMDKVVEMCLISGEEDMWLRHLDSCAKQGRVAPTLYLLQAMQSQGKLPCRETHIQIFLSACAAAKDPISAITVLTDYPFVLREPLLLRSILQICGDCGDPVSGLHVIQQMRDNKDKSIKIEIVHWNYVLNAFAECKDVEGVLQSMDIMKRVDFILPNIGSYNILLKACSKAQDFERTMMYFKLLKTEHRHLQMDRYTWSQVIQAATSTGHINEAKQLIHEMLETKKTVNLLSPFVFNHILKAYVALSDEAGIDDMIKLMRSYSVRPDSVSYQYALTLAAKLNNKEKCRSLLRTMLQETAGLNAACWRLAVAPFSRSLDVEGILELLDIIRSSSSRVESYMWRELIVIYGRLGSTNEALKVLDRMKIEDGLDPSSDCYYSALRAFIDNINSSEHRDDKASSSFIFQKAEKVFSRMRRQKLAPTTEMWTSLLVAKASLISEEIQLGPIFSLLLDMIRLDNRILSAAGWRQVLSPLVTSRSDGSSTSSSSSSSLLASPVPASILVERIESFLSQVPSNKRHTIVSALIDALLELHANETAYLTLKDVTNIQSDDDFWNALLMSAVQANQIELISKIRSTMKAQKIALTSSSFSLLLRYFINAKDFPQALALAAELNSGHEMERTTELMNELLTLFLSLKEFQRFNETLQSMHTHSIAYDQRTYLMWLQVTLQTSKSVPLGLKIIDAMYCMYLYFVDKFFVIINLVGSPQA